MCLNFFIMDLVCQKYIGLLLFRDRKLKLKFMSDNKWWSAKVDATLLSDLLIFSIFSFDIPSDFHDSVLVMPLKY